MGVLNVAYYPNERGSYKLERNLETDGRLKNPEKRWGGMMRRIETSDFETANIEYIEFWLMDPFIYADGYERGNIRKYPDVNSAPSGGYLYLNMGDISWDFLKDDDEFFEHGLHFDGHP